MIIKNGAPIQTLTRMTEKRPQWASPVHGIGPTSNSAKSQFKALYEGSNSHSHARQLMAGGVTHGSSRMPRHVRGPRLGRLCTKCATMKPMSSLKMTAVMAKMQDCCTTIQNVSRLNRNRKL